MISPKAAARLWGDSRSATKASDTVTELTALRNTWRAAGGGEGSSWA